MARHSPLDDLDLSEDEARENEGELEQLRCECSYCHNLVLFDDLDAHEL